MKNLEFKNVLILLFIVGFQFANAQLTDLVRLEYSFIPKSKSEDQYTRLRALLNFPIQIKKDAYFIVGGEAKVDTPLNTDSTVFRKAVRLSKERGYRIGIHPSYDTWKNADQMKQEKELLEHIIDMEIEISRQHTFLAFFYNGYLLFLRPNL